MKSKNISVLIFFILVCEGAGLIGTYFTIPSIPTWYATLTKSPFTPPSWVFGPVWTTLFLLMGIAAYFVWKEMQNPEKKKSAQTAFAVFASQLALNVLWSILFFGMHNPGLAFIGIIVLWLMIVRTIMQFAKVSKTAAWLLAPYILWVSFAAYLNYALWIMH